MKVSIIIPVYNVEDYVRECLLSIMQQTYEKLEIIVVNDGSTDDSINIVKSITKKDKRVKIINQENKGLSVARNTGLAHANGEYIFFVDSDDAISKDCITILVEAAMSHDSDIVCCAYARFTKKYKKVVVEKNQYIKLHYDSKGALRELFKANTKIGVMSCNKLYKKELFMRNSILFPESRLHEDNYVTYKLLALAKKITYIDLPLYYYRQRAMSIMAVFKEKRILDTLEALRQTKSFIDKKYNDLEVSFHSFDYITKLALLNAWAMTDARLGDGGNKIVYYIRKNNVRIFMNPEIPFIYKIYLMPILINIKLYRKTVRCIYFLRKKK